MANVYTPETLRRILADPRGCNLDHALSIVARIKVPPDLRETVRVLREFRRWRIEAATKRKDKP